MPRKPNVPIGYTFIGDRTAMNGDDLELLRHDACLRVVMAVDAVGHAERCLYVEPTLEDATAIALDAEPGGA